MAATEAGRRLNFVVGIQEEEGEEEARTESRNVCIFMFKTSSRSVGAHPSIDRYTHTHLSFPLRFGRKIA